MTNKDLEGITMEELLAVMQAAKCNKYKALDLINSGKAALLPEDVQTVYDLGKYAIQYDIYGMRKVVDEIKPFNYQLIGQEALKHYDCFDLSEMLGVPDQYLFFLDHEEDEYMPHFYDLESEEEEEAFRQDALKNTLTLKDVGKAYVKYLKSNNKLDELNLDYIALGKWMLNNDQYKKTDYGFVDMVEDADVESDDNLEEGWYDDVDFSVGGRNRKRASDMWSGDWEYDDETDKKDSLIKPKEKQTFYVIKSQYQGQQFCFLNVKNRNFQDKIFFAPFPVDIRNEKKCYEYCRKICVYGSELSAKQDLRLAQGYWERQFNNGKPTSQKVFIEKVQYQGPFYSCLCDIHGKFY